jgi:aminomethyltransferase
MDNITKGEKPVSLLRTPLHDLHVAAGAQMVPFVGWEMPLLYKGIIPEHQHTRRVSSIFDVSHMGRIMVTGPASLELLEMLCTRKLGDMQPGKVRYSYMCNEAGGILDDLVVARYEEEGRWGVVCNGSNREKILDWTLKHAAGKDVKVEDITIATGMVAVQGPRTREIIQPLLPFDASGLKNWSFLAGNYMGIDYYISRSGYTGEEGAEIIVPDSIAAFIWQRLTTVEPGQPEENQIRPAGLGARDTLRLEAGLPLYGHELGEQTNPIAAGFGWAVSLDKEFIGAEALRKVAADGPARKLVGLELTGRRIARQDAQVQDGSDHVIGTVTSGTLAPTINKSVAMAYLDKEYAVPGQQVVVKLRDQAIPATVVQLPFYKAKKK